MNRISFFALFSLAVFFTTSTFAAEENQKLLTTGVFTENDKGALIFTDDKDGKKYFAVKKVIEKVGEHKGKKVKINARAKAAKTGKAMLMVYLASIQPAKPKK
jgi:hypothetical protein